MAQVRVMLLRAAGTNCDRECEFAWQRVGAVVERVHIRQALAQPELIRRFQIVTIPGGFSYGDDIAAGRVFAAQLERRLVEPLSEFVGAGGLLLGICNGLQILVKAGLLPDPGRRRAARTCTVTYSVGGYQDRWVTLRAEDTPSVFCEPGRVYELPIAHGEGRVIFSDDDALQSALAQRLGALRYVPGVADADDQPFNPNGSSADLAGLCDPSGRILGLMPHPDRFTEWTQHPRWTSLPRREHGDGLAIFARGAAYFR